MGAQGRRGLAPVGERREARRVDRQQAGAGDRVEEGPRQERLPAQARMQVVDEQLPGGGAARP